MASIQSNPIQSNHHSISNHHMKTYGVAGYWLGYWVVGWLKGRSIYKKGILIILNTIKLSLLIVV